MDRAQERERSDRLRNRLSGAGGIVPTRPAQPSRRRSGSLDDTSSQVSMSSNAPTVGSGSHLGSSRVARSGRNRRPKVSFPSNGSQQSTGSVSDNSLDFLRQRTERQSLKSAMKTPQRPSTPPLPADSTTGPSFASLSDSQESSRRSIRPRRRLSFKEPSTTTTTTTQDKRRSVPGSSWAERFLPQVTNANALMRREPFSRHDSFGSDTDYTDSELSDDTHATTVMSDATVGSPKVQKRQTTTVTTSVPVVQTRQQAPPTSAPSVGSSAPAPTKPAGRKLTIEVHPARETEEEVRKREEEKRRRERIEADLRSKIAGLEKRMQAEAEDNARQQQQVQRQIASVAAKQKERQAPASAPTTPAPPAPSRQAPVPPISRLSTGRTESTPASPQLNAQARPFQPSPRPSPRPLSMTANMGPVVPPMSHVPQMPSLDMMPPFLQQAVPAMPMPAPLPMPMVQQPPAMAQQAGAVDATLQQQLEAQAAQLASLRTALAAAEAERDENKTGMTTLSEQCQTLEADVRTVRAAVSQSEEVTIAKLAACELVRDLLRVKVEGFESEVKTKAMVIEGLSAERDRLAVALEASAAEVAVLSERSRMLDEDRERAHGDMLALKEELVNARAAAEALEKDKAELEGKVAGLQGDLGTAHAKLAELEGVVKDKEGCIEQLKKDGDEAKASNDELRKEVEQLAAASATKDQELVEVTAKLAEAESTLATSQSSLATLEASLATTTEEKTKEISNLQEKLAAAETAAATALATAETNMATATAEKEAEIAALNDKLTAAAAAKESELASLNDKLAAATAEKEAELAALHDQLAAAQAETTKAEAEIQNLEGRTPEDHAASLATAAREKDELAGRVAALQAEVESRAAEANDMVTTFATEKAALEADRAAVESERNELEEARAAAAAEAARLSLHVTQLKAKVEASKNKKTVPTTAAASAAAAVKSTKTVKTKADFFFVRTSQDRGRMQVVKKSELKSSRSSSRTPSAKDDAIHWPLLLEMASVEFRNLGLDVCASRPSSFYTRSWQCLIGECRVRPTPNRIHWKTPGFQGFYRRGVMPRLKLYEFARQVVGLDSRRIPDLSATNSPFPHSFKTLFQDTGGVVTAQLFKPEFASAQLSRVVAVDLDPGVVAFTSQRAAEEPGWAGKVEVLRAGQHPLPLPDGAFSHAFNNFAVSAPDDDATLRETLRLLRPGGVAGFTTWRNPAWWDAVAVPAVRNYIPDAPPLPGLGAIFPDRGWGDNTTAEARLTAAGFVDVESRDFVFAPDLPAAEFCTACSGLVKAFIKFKWSPEQNEQFAALIAGAMQRHLEDTAGGRWNAKMYAIITFGRKPGSKDKGASL
ncbi:hypothetical protein MGG_15612 [Pyricularia oryzae 70-15]|uniref:Methyltransferase type 11 domain-containing protein n=1 Tax=Pyricularia oryzae (strain 70-15 / ATCC MYA-4617 / FGSC 8958) TaxID=242507 RepID=G4MW13_PYRO7|nr:uncharacterized protein MGG_15612 [Pyricularia oryzae 70-15]EHA54166.1 hypothetical protein MGG_15612 [Pyricularia oryzae 70-15]